MNKKTLMVSIIILAIDQIIKMIVDLFMEVTESIKVIKNFFYITAYHNSGVAWGLLSDHKWLIILFTFGALLLIYHFIYCFKDNIRNNIAFGLIIGGLLGNLLDRILFGYVRDFIDIIIIKYDYPIFNIADMAIVIGVLLLIFAILKGEDINENNSKGSRRKTRQVRNK